MTTQRFKTIIDKQGRKFIVAPNGEKVIEYWNCNFGRLGNLREFNAEFTNGETIICRHGGALRTLLKYLNTGEWSNDYDERDLYAAGTLGKLDELRKQAGNDND